MYLRLSISAMVETHYKFWYNSSSKTLVCCWCVITIIISSKKPSCGRKTMLYLHESSWVKKPEVGVVNLLLGPDSQVATPLALRMYLYSSDVLAERLTP